MRIVLSDSKSSSIDAVATLLYDRLSVHPTSVIGLATGKTMEPVYAAFVEMVKANPIKLDRVFFFMLDEYLGLPDGHPSSFKAYIQTHLIKPLELSESQFAFPPVHAGSIHEAAEHYELSLKESGGIDLQLLGIGTNGHIGFNEPGSTKTSRTRLVHLTGETQKSNQGQFVDGKVPSDALSMGIGTILDAKNLIMLATGESKAAAMKYLMNHHDDPTCPATYLKSHSHFVLVLDPEAASKINLKI